MFFGRRKKQVRAVLVLGVKKGDWLFYKTRFFRVDCIDRGPVGTSFVLEGGAGPFLRETDMVLIYC